MGNQQSSQRRGDAGHGIRTLSGRTLESYVPAAAGQVSGAQSAAWAAETDSDWEIRPTVEEQKAAGGSLARKLILAAGIVLLALLPRLLFLYVITDPEVMIPSWSNDSWHRWQIAYLTKDVGIHQDPPRLWDLKGLEYFWGIVHPLISGIVFSLTGSVDIMILRWTTMLAGALNILLLFYLGRRFWNAQVGAAVALFAILNPIVIFNDPSGMVEPLSFLFLLAGIYFYPDRSILTGLLWGVAAMTRAEAWVMSLGLVAAALVARETSTRKIGLLAGYGIPLVLYMKHLLDITGSAIYPIYWNFLANAAGRWEFREELTVYQLAARPVLGAVFVIAALAALWVLWKRPRGYLLLLLGLGTTAFISGFIGLTAYLKSYEPWFWLTRFFVFPYLFLGLLMAILLFHWLPKRLPGAVGSNAAWAACIPVLIAMQLTWPAVMEDVDTGYTSQTAASYQRAQAQVVAVAYSGGTVLMPEGNPQLTYALGRYAGIDGANLLGQMYGPDFYFEEGDPLAHWDEVGPLMWDWFAERNVTVLVMDIRDQRFLKMIEERPERFEHVGTLPGGAMEVYRVQP